MGCLLPGVRAPAIDELSLLQVIDVAAGQRFRHVGMDSIADGQPTDIDLLEAFRRAGRAWVVTDDHDLPVGYAVAMVVDGYAHLQQVSVLAEHGGKGLGRRLVDQVEEWARAHGLPAVTLTTFRDVPWNGPLYARWGFEVLANEQLTPGLRQIREQEIAQGIEVAVRQCMIRPVREVI